MKLGTCNIGPDIGSNQSQGTSTEYRVVGHGEGGGNKQFRVG